MLARGDRQRRCEATLTLLERRLSLVLGTVRWAGELYRRGLAMAEASCSHWRPIKKELLFDSRALAVKLALTQEVTAKSGPFVVSLAGIET
jgi:hypothetical protein